MTVLTLPAAPMGQAWRVTGLPTQVRLLTGRSLRPLRQPGMLLASTAEPLIMLILFGGVFQVLGSTPGTPPGVAYIDNLLPAILIIATLTNGVQAGAALIEDLRNGVIARLRAMPVRMFSVLLARSFADSVRALFQMTIIAVLGALLFGFSPPGGFLGAIGAVVIAVLVGWSVGWVFILLAAVLRNGQAMQAITTLLTFPLMFASNSFVTLDALPGWLEVVAVVNPITYANVTAREVALGQADFLQVTTTVGICLLMVAVLAPLADRAFRRL